MLAIFACKHGRRACQQFSVDIIAWLMALLIKKSPLLLSSFQVPVTQTRESGRARDREMKVPLTSTQIHRSSSALKPLSDGIVDQISRPESFNGSTAPANSGFEPKSVLDLRRSPSPASQWDDILNIDNFDNWESLVTELGLIDDSSPVAKSIDPQFSVPSNFETSSTQFLGYNLNSSDLCANFGFSFADKVIQAANFFDSNQVQLAQMILAQIDEQLPNLVGNLNHLQRAAFYFKEALQSLLCVSTRPTRPSSLSEVVQAIKAYKVFTSVSPIVMFSDFTVNQAILEAVNGAMFIHVIDFDIGFGGKWASFMREIAEKARVCEVYAPVLRITAVVPEEYEIESRLITETLYQFASELILGFEIEFVSIQTFESLRFEAIEFRDGENTAVLLSPLVFQLTGTGILDDLRRISPSVVVLVEGERIKAPSFHRSVVDGLEYYSAVMETLAAAHVNGGDEWMEQIEKYVLRPRIFAAMEAAGRTAPPWREAFAAPGMRAVGWSWFSGFQAECLTWKVRGSGFQVMMRRQAEMVLCRHGRALVSTSAWRFQDPEYL
ncbi:hypothetical protein NMG60_11026162 [Bertholletia excelsa]